MLRYYPVVCSQDREGKIIIYNDFELDWHAMELDRKESASSL